MDISRVQPLSTEPRKDCRGDHLSADAIVEDSPTTAALDPTVKKTETDSEWEPEYSCEDT